MTAEIARRTPAEILEGERGEYLIPNEMLVRQSADDLHTFTAVMLAEARRRGLQVSVRDDLRLDGVLVYWRPDPHADDVLEGEVEN